MQLAAADEHGADLGQLAAVARLPVRLGVDGEELGLGDRGFEQRVVRHGPRVIRLRPDGMNGALQPDPGYIRRVRMRTSVVVVLAAAFLAAGLGACGADEDYANRPRPPSPINVTAAIDKEQRARLARRRSAAARS